jgi:hypothetical protein
MHQLQNERKAVEVELGKWMEEKGDDPRIRLIKFYCAGLVRSTIRNNGGSVSVARLISDVFHFILESGPEFRKLGVSWSLQESRQKAEEIIDDMTAQGDILRRGMNCSLGTTH